MTQVQVVRGTTSSAPAVADLWRGWIDAVAPVLPGWLDVTGGVTADGDVVCVTRFADEEAARRALDHPDHRAWWQNTQPVLGADVQVHASDDVGPPEYDADPAAGFVQMMLATVADRPAVERIEHELDEAFRRWRPDSLGGYRVWLPGGKMLAVDYFTSEAEARAGESSEPPPEVADALPRWLALMGDVEWFDLRHQWVARA